MKKLKSYKENNHSVSFNVFPWNNNFETGIAKIDEQHKILVKLLNDLSKTLINDEEIEIKKAFDKLADYTTFHFKDEETIWTEYFSDDQKLLSHKKNHSSFLPKITELKEQNTDTPLSDVVENIIKFLIHWLAFHIIDIDKRMALTIEALHSGYPLEEAKQISDEKMSGSMRILVETVLNMYDILSSRAIDLLRERKARIKAEEKLREANRKLEELSITDQLTGLYNRRYFDKVFESELKRAKRNRVELTFIMIDIDCFKNFNDNFGHIGGDATLKKVAAKIQDCCRRSNDFAFRIGGEEFGVLATNIHSEKAVQLGEKLRTSIEHLKIEHKYNRASDYVTVSIGVFNKIPSLDDTVNSFNKIADNRLYQAKASGRNRVIAS